MIGYFCINIYYVKYKRYEQTLNLRQTERLIKLDDSKFNVFYVDIKQFFILNT